MPRASGAHLEEKYVARTGNEGHGSATLTAISIVNNNDHEGEKVGPTLAHYRYQTGERHCVSISCQYCVPKGVATRPSVPQQQAEGGHNDAEVSRVAESAQGDGEEVPEHDGHGRRSTRSATAGRLGSRR